MFFFLHIYCVLLKESVFPPNTIRFSFATVFHFLASCYISPVLLDLIFQDSTRGCQAKVWRRTRNIPAQLRFAPEDSQQYRSHALCRCILNLISYMRNRLISDFSLSVSILLQEENISYFLFYFSILFLSSFSIILFGLSYLKRHNILIIFLYYNSYPLQRSQYYAGLMNHTDNHFFLNLYQSHFSNNSKSTPSLSDKTSSTLSTAMHSVLSIPGGFRHQTYFLAKTHYR